MIPAIQGARPTSSVERMSAPTLPHRRESREGGSRVNCKWSCRRGHDLRHESKAAGVAHGISEVLRWFVTTFLRSRRPQRIRRFSRVTSGTRSARSGEVPWGKARLFRPSDVFCWSQKGSHWPSASSAWWRGAGFTRVDHDDTPRPGTVRSASSRRAAGRIADRQLARRLLWSPTRVSAWRKAISRTRTRATGSAPDPKFRLEAAVLPGTDDRTLDRGLGHIESTAQPGTDGNSGIAGHRDGFFRALKDIAQDDLIELDTQLGTEVYRVERTWIVDPEDVSGTGSDAGARADARHLLSVLLRRLRSAAIHRPCGACWRQAGVLVESGSRPVRLTSRNR